MKQIILAAFLLCLFLFGTALGKDYYVFNMCSNYGRYLHAGP